jgi:heme oxygenase
VTTTSGQLPRTAPFSAQLRELSRADHGRAESAGVLRDLFTGELSRAGYAAMVGQLLLVYSALEEVGEELRDDPVAGAFVSPALVRRPALLADYAVLTGGAGEPAPLPATAAYCNRIREVATWPGGFVAHHYTRYLGDLSGGPAIGGAAARAFGLTVDAGVAFYDFPRIPDPHAFKAAYRAQLDAAPWDDAEQARVGEEVLAAYAHNVALLDELGPRARA